MLANFIFRPSKTASPSSYFNPVHVCCGLKILVVLGSSFYTSAILRFFEASVCRTYFESHGGHGGVELLNGEIPEHLCKTDEIQSHLATFTGWLGFFGVIPGNYASALIHNYALMYGTIRKGLLVAIPYGHLAEYTSRRKLLFVNLVSALCAQIYVVPICENLIIPLQIAYTILICPRLIRLFLAYIQCQVGLAFSVVRLRRWRRTRIPYFHTLHHCGACSKRGVVSEMNRQDPLMVNSSD
jgi:hypothetical protein